MTIVMTPTGPTADPAVSWRALDSGLWVARRSGRHLGSVERGRRWSAAGPDGEPLGAFRTLLEAQTAVTDPAARRVQPDAASAAAPIVAAAALGIAAIASASGWALTSLLA